MAKLPDNLRSLVTTNNNHRDLLDPDVLDKPTHQVTSFFTQLGRIERHTHRRTRQQLADAQFAARQDQINTQLIINREICKSTIEQLRISLREGVQSVLADSTASRSLHESELLVATAETIDAQLARLERIRNTAMRDRLQQALLAKLDNLFEQLGG